MNSIGQLNDESKDRADKAAKMFFSKKNIMIITSGWAYRKDTNITVADALRIYLNRVHSIPINKIYCQHNSRDTVGDALFSHFYVKKNFPTSKIIVITSDYHVERTKKIFEFVYGKTYIIEVVGVETSIDKKNIYKLSEKKSLEAFIQTFKNIKAGDISNISERLSEKHPYYNGEKYAKLLFNNHKFNFPD